MPTEKKTRPAPRGLRAALKQRVTNETEYRLPIRPLPEVQAIHEELKQARGMAAAGEFLKAKNGNTEEIERTVEAAKVAAEQLQAKFDACFYIVRFRPLPADDFDALVQLHPPKEGEISEAQQAGEEPPLWHDATFYPDLLERCAVNSELTAEEWALELASWSRAERKEVQAKALEANVRGFGTALSFG